MTNYIAQKAAWYNISLMHGTASSGSLQRCSGLTHIGVEFILRGFTLY